MRSRGAGNERRGRGFLGMRVRVGKVFRVGEVV